MEEEGENPWEAENMCSVVTAADLSSSTSIFFLRCKDPSLIFSPVDLKSVTLSEAKSCRHTRSLGFVLC